MLHISKRCQWSLREEPIQLPEPSRRYCTLREQRKFSYSPHKHRRKNQSKIRYTLCQVAGNWNKDAGFEITRIQFGEGNDMYTFSLVPSDLNELYLMPYINPVRQGNVLLEVKVAAITTKTLNCRA